MFVFSSTLFSLQGHMCLLQGYKVYTRTRYFNAWEYSNDLLNNTKTSKSATYTNLNAQKIFKETLIQLLPLSYIYILLVPAFGAKKNWIDQN